LSDAAAKGDHDARVEELLRVNAGLAAELRSLTAARTEAPRSSSMTASRRLGALIDERDTAIANFGATRTHLEHVERQLEQVEGDRDAIAQGNAELTAELLRVRSGFRGLLRRARARLLNRRR